jgi:hypothetical protein
MAGNPQVIVEYIAETAKLVAGMRAAGQATSGAADATKKVDWKNVAKWSGAAVAVGAGAAFIKSASDATVQLTKDTLGLQRQTNLDTKTASEWVSVLQTRGIESATFGTALGRLSKTMETSRVKSNDYAQKIRELGADMAAVREKGGKDMEKNLGKLSDQMDRARDSAAKARKPFADLGINFQQVKAGNISEVILQAADAISKMESPTKRAAAAQALFGKQGLKLLPILMQGRKGIEDNLKTADKYGATVGDKQVAATKKMVAAQRELALAHKGVQVAIGSALLPAQAELYTSLLHIVQVVMPFASNMNVMKGVLIAAAVAMGVYKVAVIASTIASIGLNAAMLPEIAIAVGIAAAIAALIAVGILLYKHWDQLAALAGTVWGAVKAAAMDAFNWIKTNWPLLAGILLAPFTGGLSLVAALIYRHWGAIKSFLISTFNAIRNAVSTAWNAIVGIIASTGNAIRNAVVAVWNAAKSAVSTAMGAIRSVVTAGFNAVVSVVTSAMGRLVGAIRNAVSRAVGAARAIATGVKAVFGGAIGWLVAAGIAIVDGLAHGIRSAIGNAVSAIKEAGHAVVNAGLSVLHIKSPSADFVSMGYEVANGLAVGIQRGTPAATKAARDMAKKTMDAAETTIKARAATLQDFLTQAFQARQGAAQTPAEQQLAELQRAHDEQQRQQALADAQGQLASAQTAEERVSAQRAVNDALYAIQVAALQDQATAQRTALDQQQKDEQRAFDASLKALNTYLNSAHATAAGARKKINALISKYGLDFATVGNLLGQGFATGLEKSTKDVIKAADKLTAAVRAALREGLKIGSPSKVAIGYGREVSRGLALGISRHSGLVSNAFRLAVPSTALAVSPLVQAASGPVNVRVFIGETELRGIVQAEISTDNTRVARRLLAGSR